MDIRLLGPLEVRADDGALLPVTAPMLRATLAALALRAGRVTAVDELAGLLWGEESPASARTTVRNYVMRLRRTLPKERIRTVSGGYLLAVDHAETDLGRFERALARSRELAPQAPERAMVLLDEAMTLWRGAPLADLRDGPLRDAELPRLTELRLTGLEERFELKLALGHHALIVHEVAAEARAHHLRERLTRQLMLALYRCGRTAEALAAYRELRARLVEELGIEPGEELRMLEQAVLRGDRRLAIPVPSLAAPPAPRMPGNQEGRFAAGAAFPPSPPTFVARGLELGQLRRQLSGAMIAPAICLIDGPGGVGKSALAVRAAREVADRFPDGLLYADLCGADPHNPPLEPAEVRRLLLASLGTPGKEVPQDPAAADAFFRERLYGSRVLLLLDNALDAAQVAPLLPTGPGSAALVTSRAALTGLGGGHHLHLDTLSTPESVALVQVVAGAAEERGTRAEWELLVALCGRLPLALRIVAARMAARPRWRVGDLAAVLADERRRMDELAADDLDLRASLMVSIDQLAAGSGPADRLAADLFPLLGAAAVRSFSPGSAAALAGCSAHEARAAMERLTDAQIAASPRPGVYRLHDLVRSAAAWHAARLPAERTAGRLAELARWYIGSLYRVNGPLALPDRYRTRYQDGADRFPQGRPFTSVDESLPWADEALDDVVALAQQLAGPEFDRGSELGGRPLADFALESVRALESYFGMRLTWRAQRRLCEIALAVGERRGDPFARAVAYGQLGKAAGQQGDGERGVELLRRGVRLFQEAGQPLEAMATAMNVVPCLGAAGHIAEAAREAERALAETLAAGMHDVCAQLVNNLGRCRLLLGDHAEAHRLLSVNYESTARPYERTMAAGVLAEYHLDVGEFEEAARWAQRAIGHAAEQPFDPFVLAQQRVWLAAALRGLGREDAARAEETQASAVLEDLNSRENSHLRVRVEARYAIS